MTPVENVLSKLSSVKRSRDGWIALCPAHDDHRQSLSVDVADDGRVLLKCFAGCETADVLQALSLEWSDLFADEPGRRRPADPIVATYDYRDADNRLVFQVVRKASKAFPQRRPDGAGGWVWNLNGVERVLYRLPELLAADLDGPVFLVEGEKDADRLIDVGLVATTNPGGADKWRDSYSETLRGRRVVILPDNDEPGRDHARTVATSLAGVAESVRVVELPDLPAKGDVSDWLDVGHTAYDLLRLANEAPGSEPARLESEEIEALDGDPPEGWTKYLADAIQETDHFAVDVGYELYRYREGVYAGDGRRHVGRRCKQLLEALEQAQRWTTYRVSQVVEYIRIDAPALWDRPPLDVVNVKNGLLDLETGELQPHSPDHLSTVQLPVLYDPQADCPAWQEFIAGVFPDDSQDLPWELVAWLMTCDTSIQKAVLLLGEGRNGKSTFLTALATFLGRKNVAGVSLHRLEANRFTTARLVGKLANICPDLPSGHLAGTSTFKALTGGDLIHGERKYGESFEFESFARLVFSANTPPQSADSSHAFFRRWLVIPFDRTFTDDDDIPREEMDRRLSDPKELSGVLNMALIHLQRVRRQGIAETESMRQAWYEFREVTDPLEVWLDLNTVESLTAYVEKGDLLRAYNEDAKSNGRPPMTAGMFGKAVKRWRPEVQDQRKRLGDSRSRVWVGVGLRTKEGDLS